MTVLQTIQKHVEHFPPEKQAEVLNFVLFVEQSLQISEKDNAVPRCALRDEPAIGLWKNRKDMQDSSEWVRNLRRAAWQRDKAKL